MPLLHHRPAPAECAVSGAKGVERVFYLFDSMDAVVLKGEEEIHCYDYIRHSQIGWYRSYSEHFTPYDENKMRMILIAGKPRIKI